jgi:hypothetical protein
MTRLFRLTPLAVVLACSSPAEPALNGPKGPRVLLLWDVRNEQTEGLARTLRNAGVQVTFSQTNGPGFNGENPPLKGFDVVVHLNGTTWMTDMPESGQRALVEFLESGGGYVHHEWNAYQLSVGQLQKLRPLILFDRTSGYAGEITLTKVEAPRAHPVVWEVPRSFTMQGSSNIGHVHVFDPEPAMVLARDSHGNDAIAVREHALGRIVGFHHGGNWEYASRPTILETGSARRLFVDAVRWAYGCDPAFREGRREQICAEIARRRALVSGRRAGTQPDR